MVSYDHVGQGAVVVRFYPTLRLLVIGVSDANVAVDGVLRKDAVRFLDVFGALPFHLIHIQVSDSLAVQDALGLVRADKLGVTVVNYHPLLELLLVHRARDDSVHFIYQGSLVYRDLETADLNDPCRECIIDILQDVHCPSFGGGKHTTLPLCDMPLQLPGVDHLFV